MGIGNLFKGADDKIKALGSNDDKPSSRMTATLSMSNISLLIILFMILPIWLLGMNVVLTIMKFMRQPLLNGYVPMWVVIGMVILFIIYVNKNR